MSRFHLKNLPTSISWLIRPALFLSLGLHLLLLLLPVVPDRASDSTETEETEVSLTPLPIEPIPEATPSAVPSPALPPSVSPSPASNPPAPVPSPVPPLVLSPSPAPSVSQPTPAAQPAASVSPATPAATPPTPSATTAVAPPQNRVIAPFANFPDMAGAQPGCFNQSAGGCRQVTGNFRQVSQALTAQLTSQGYDVKRRDDLEETGRLVYEVTKDGSTRYLSVLSSDLAGTAYILADEPVTQADIEQISTVQTDLQTLLSSLTSGNTATPAEFAYPEFFFTDAQPRPEITQPVYLAAAAPTEIADRLTSTLEANGFQFSQIGEYGGGPIYEVGRKAFLGYVNLVPTQDGTGTIVVLWQSVSLSNDESGNQQGG